MRRRRPFTLIELTVVLVIILLIAGIAVGRFGKMPQSATLDKTVREIESFFAVAERSAAVRGRLVTVRFLPEKNGFTIADDLAGSDGFERTNREYLTENYRNLYLIPEVGVRFQDFAESNENVMFSCTPDGMTTGPRIYLELGGRKANLRFSRLTGRLLKETNE